MVHGIGSGCQSPFAQFPLNPLELLGLAALGQAMLQGPQSASGVQAAGGDSFVRGPAGMDTRTACEVLKKHFDSAATGKFKTVDEESLRDVIASDDAPAELKQAANTLLNNPTALGQIQGAHADGLANGITMADLNTVTSPGNTTLDGIDAGAIGNLPAGSQQQASAILLKHFDTAASGKFKSIDEDSLRDIISSESAPAELKWAANQFLNNPAWLGSTAGAHADGPFLGGQAITRRDLNAVLSPGFQG